MSMSALMAALRGAGRQQLSASTVVPRRATGSHILRIDKYTEVSKMMSNGHATRSGTFSVGGHDWRVLCYPNGCVGNKGYISLFLEHASHARTGDAMAEGKLSILDQAGTPSCTYPVTECSFDRMNLAWGNLDFMKHEDLDREEHLRDDRLTILCDVTVAGAHIVNHEKFAAPPLVLHRRLADVKIEVGGETFPAHRWVLEAGSPVFKADLSLASVAGDNIALLRVDGMDARVFKALLRFIYTNSPPLLEEAAKAEKMLVAADRYELEKLKLICEEALCRYIDTSSVAATLALAERHHCSMLRTACIEFLSSPGNLEAFVAADGFVKLKTDCPSALSDLVVKRMPYQQQ